MTLLVFNYGFSQDYKSMVKEDRYIKINIHEEQGTVYVTKTEIQKENGLGSRVYNVAKLEIEDGRIEIPETGNYWWIPFEDNQNPINLRPYATYCYECSIYGGCYSPNTCVWRSVGSDCYQCDCGGDPSHCFVTKCPCGDPKNKITGGGILIMAKNVTLE